MSSFFLPTLEKSKSNNIVNNTILTIANSKSVPRVRKRQYLKLTDLFSANFAVFTGKEDWGQNKSVGNELMKKYLTKGLK